MSDFKAKMYQIQFPRLQRSPRPRSWINGACFEGKGTGRGEPREGEGTRPQPFTPLPLIHIFGYAPDIYLPILVDLSILMFHKMALIFPRVPIVFTLSSFE